MISDHRPPPWATLGARARERALAWLQSLPQGSDLLMNARVLSCRSGRSEALAPQPSPRSSVLPRLCRSYEIMMAGSGAASGCAPRAQWSCPRWARYLGEGTRFQCDKQSCRMHSARRVRKERVDRKGRARESGWLPVIWVRTSLELKLKSCWGGRPTGRGGGARSATDSLPQNRPSVRRSLRPEVTELRRYTE